MSCKVAMILSNPFINDPRVFKEARALVDKGYKVSVFAWDRECKYPEQESRQGISIERIHVKSSYERGLLQAPALLLFSFQVLRHLRSLRFDVIHCHDLETLPVGLLAGQLTKAKVIFDAHEPNYYADTQRLRFFTVQIGKVLEKLLARWASVVLVTNDYQINKYHKMKVQNVRIVANYPEMALIPSKTLREEKNRITIGRIGAIHENAGVDHLIDAFILLRSEYPAIALKIAGGTSCSDIGLLFEKLSFLGNCIEFVPGYHYAELKDLYAELDIWVMPANPDSFYRYVTPTKFFEALCFGVPVVVSDVGGIGKVVKEKNCGIVLEEVSARSIAAAVKYLIDNPKLQKEMGENGQKAIKDKYNWDVSVKELLAAYENL